MGPKLMAAFILLLLFALVVGAAGYKGMLEVVTAARQTHDVARLTENLQATRKQEKEYIVTKEQTMAENTLKAIDHLQKTAQQTAAEQKRHQIAAKLDNVDNLLRQYEQVFTAYVNLESQRQEAIGQMMAAANTALSTLNSWRQKVDSELYDIADIFLDAENAQEFEAELDAYQDDVLKHLDVSQTAANMVIYFINARKFEKQYLISQQDKYYQRLQKTVDMVAKMASELEEKAAYAKAMQKVKQALNQYTQALNTSLQKTNKQDELEQRLNGVADKCLAAGQQIRKQQQQFMQQRITTAQQIQITTLALAILAGLGLALLFSRRIAGAMRETVHMVQELGRGHLDSRLPVRSEDEIGQMARAMNGFADTLQHEVLGCLTRLEQGDLTFTAQPVDGQDKIRGTLKQLSEQLNGLMQQIQQAGRQIASSSGQVADTSQSLSQATTEQASSLEEITSSMAQMAQQTQQNAQHAQQANELVQQVQQEANQGSGQVEQMVSAMEDINASSASITKIIKSIDEIAFQTNLLALNAAVEAARAGQHGKGFAVVAEEVRNLAARSGKAAQETESLINDSVQKVKSGSAIAENTVTALEGIQNKVGEAAGLVSEIAAASHEQAQGISQINSGLEQIDQVTQQNTGNAEQGAAAAEELDQQAAALQQLLNHFQLGQAANTSQEPAASNLQSDHQKALAEKG